MCGTESGDVDSDPSSFFFSYTFFGIPDLQSDKRTSSDHLDLLNPHFFSDPSGALNFSGKAVLHASGVDFSNGSSFAINMEQLQLDEELGKGNYGTVKKVLHRPTNVAMAMKASHPYLLSTPAEPNPFQPSFIRKSALNSMKQS